MTRRTSRRRSSRRLCTNKGFDTVYYWNGKWRAAAPLPPPLGRGETLGEMKAAIERMGYVAVLGVASRGAPKTAPWRLQQNSRKRSSRRRMLRSNSEKQYTFRLGTYLRYQGSASNQGWFYPLEDQKNGGLYGLQSWIKDSGRYSKPVKKSLSAYDRKIWKEMAPPSDIRSKFEEHPGFVGFLPGALAENGRDGQVYNGIAKMARDADDKAHKALDRDNYASAVKWFRAAANYHRTAAFAAAPRDKQEHLDKADGCEREAEIFAMSPAKQLRARGYR